jgi:hypothetical protein
MPHVFCYLSGNGNENTGPCLATALRMIEVVLGCDLCAGGWTWEQHRPSAHSSLCHSDRMSGSNALPRKWSCCVCCHSRLTGAGKQTGWMSCSHLDLFPTNFPRLENASVSPFLLILQPIHFWSAEGRLSSQFPGYDGLFCCVLSPWPQWTHRPLMMLEASSSIRNLGSHMRIW